MGRKRLFQILALCLAVGAAVALVAAQGGFDLSWWTVDGGGGASSGGPYSLSGTAGQPDAGDLSAGRYALRGGFWVDGAANPPSLVPRLYLPLVSSGSP